MGVQLLDKTRKINKLLHNNSSSKVVFNDICEVLTEILDSNVLVISKKGKVLGGSKCEGVPYITELIEREIGKHVDDMLNERLLSILSTKENVNLQTLGFSEEAVKGYQAIITPIDIAGERLGTLFIYKKDKFKEGLPIYHIDRYVRETGKLFEDGSHIIYVNGSYKGEGEIAQLIEDFHQKESEDMHYKALADGVKHFKETEEGFWMSGGHPVRTDRSEAETVKLCVNQ